VAQDKLSILLGGVDMTREGTSAIICKRKLSETPPKLQLFEYYSVILDMVSEVL
jgi:hypothetical protein